jgi:hypothetical protein
VVALNGAPNEHKRRADFAAAGGVAIDRTLNDNWHAPHKARFDPAPEKWLAMV